MQGMHSLFSVCYWYKSQVVMPEEIACTGESYRDANVARGHNGTIHPYLKVRLVHARSIIGVAAVTAIVTGRLVVTCRLSARSEAVLISV